MFCTPLSTHFCVFFCHARSDAVKILNQNGQGSWAHLLCGINWSNFADAVTVARCASMALLLPHCALTFCLCLVLLIPLIRLTLNAERLNIKVSGEPDACRAHAEVCC